MKRLLCIALCLILLGTMGCTSGEKNKTEEETMHSEYPIATITMKDGGVIKLELYPKIAPESVKNFISLANSKFYDGLIFHRVISGFMIQGGCPKGNGTGGPGYNIKGEFSANGVDNSLSHERGVISMARSNNPDSASSQFFIMHQDNDYLDGKYAAFGKVTDGMDVVDAIASVEVQYGLGGTEKSSPVTPVVIEYVKVLEG